MSFKIIHEKLERVKASTMVNFVNKGYVVSLRNGEDLIYFADKDKVYAEIEENIGDEKIVVTNGYNLCDKIIHVVVDDISTVTNLEEYIFTLYKNILNKCKELKTHSICIPLISSFFSEYQVDVVYFLAIKAISEYLKNTDFNLFVILAITSDIVFTFPSKIDNELMELFKGINSRIFEKKKDEKTGRNQFSEASLVEQKEKFYNTFIDSIEKSHLNEFDIYKRGNISRRAFSLIKNKNFSPSKKMIFTICITLEYDLSTTEKYLNKYNYFFDNTLKFDIILKYFIMHKIYDIYEIDGYLYKYTLDQLSEF
jgi:O-acetyl-ADP-ribose deacetylase (regulator of RNase III)